jgi:hypothetical protein
VWDTKIASLVWMLEQHPEIGRDKRGASRVYGQLAFAEAARGERRTALRWAARAWRAHPLQWRAPLAVLVAARVVSSDRVLDTLHKHGRGV